MRAPGAILVGAAVLAIAASTADARDPSPKFAAEITARLKLLDGNAPRRPFIKTPSFRNLQDEVDEAIDISDVVNPATGTRWNSGQLLYAASHNANWYRAPDFYGREAAQIVEVLNMMQWRATGTWTFSTATSGFAAQQRSSGAACDYDAATNTYSANAQMQSDWAALFNKAVANAATNPISYEEGGTIGLPLGTLVGTDSNGVETVRVIRDIGQIQFPAPLYKSTQVAAVRLLLTEMPGTPPTGLHIFWQTNTSFQQVDFTNFNAAGTQEVPGPASRTPASNGQVRSTYNLPPRLLVRPAAVPKGKAFQPHYWAQVWVRFQGDEPPTPSGFPPAGPFATGCGWSARRYELSQQLIIKEKLPKLKSE